MKNLNNQLLTWKNNYLIYAGLLLVLALTLITRTINLHYNSPFNDEAIYVVVGRLGLFQGDWVSYNPSAWVAGHPYAYPSLTALAYSTAGIVGSRFLNVLFGVLLTELVFMISVHLYHDQETKLKYLAGFISAIIVGAAAVVSYVSRLATYDMPSFYFLFLGILLLLYAQKKSGNLGKLYFFAATSFFVSLMFKIIVGIYLPLILIFGFYQARQLGSTNLFYFKRYLLAPLILGLIFFVLTNFSTLQIFFHTQVSREVAGPVTLLEAFSRNSYYIAGFLLLGSIGMWNKSYFRKWLFLIGLGALILIFHLITKRLATLDKHTMLSVVFASIVSGVGITQLVSQIKLKVIQKVLIGYLILVLGIYWIFSYGDSERFNTQWENGEIVTNYLQKNIQPGDKILTEAGAATILDVYEKNPPLNTTTFDWFTYGKLQDETAYQQAIKDGYFNFVELETDNVGKSNNETRLHQLVSENIDQNYKIAFQQGNFLIYKRDF